MSPRVEKKHSLTAVTCHTWSSASGPFQILFKLKNEEKNGSFMIHSDYDLCFQIVAGTLDRPELKIK